MGDTVNFCNNSRSTNSIYLCIKSTFTNAQFFYTTVTSSLLLIYSIAQCFFLSKAFHVFTFSFYYMSFLLHLCISISSYTNVTFFSVRIFFFLIYRFSIALVHFNFAVNNFARFFPFFCFFFGIYQLLIIQACYPLRGGRIKGCEGGSYRYNCQNIIRSRRAVA